MEPEHLVLRQTTVLLGFHPSPPTPLGVQELQVSRSQEFIAPLLELILGFGFYSTPFYHLGSGPRLVNSFQTNVVNSHTTSRWKNLSQNQKINV